MSSSSDVDLRAEEPAKELAVAYRKMSGGLGSGARHSTGEIADRQAAAEVCFEELHGTRLRQRFHALVGLDGDRGRAWDKLLKEFPM